MQCLWTAAISGRAPSMDTGSLFLIVFSLEVIRKKQIRGLTTLGSLFVIQALLSAQLPIIVIFLFSLTSFLCWIFHDLRFATQRPCNAKSFPGPHLFFTGNYWNLAPIGGEALALAVALTIVMRLFKWPCTNWVSHISQDKSLLSLCVGALSSFGCWRTQTVGQELIWAFVWFATAMTLSFGSETVETVTAFHLGLFSISPIWAVLSVAFGRFWSGDKLSIWVLGF